MKQLHKIQLSILKKLLFCNSLRYGKVKPSTLMENNKFDFHLKELIKAGYVKRSGDQYSLTNIGKEFANRMDTNTKVISSQAKISAWFCCHKKIGESNKYLIYTRLKQPFYGCQGFPSGKVQFGETVLKAAERELYEETTLKGKPKIVLIRHYLVYDKNNNNLLEDKFMFLCNFDNPKGKLKHNNEGKYEWVEKNDIKKYITNPFESYHSFKQIIDTVDDFDGTPKFVEIKHFSHKF